MDYITSFIMIALVATIHASFQLSISTLTLMSGHSLGAQQSHQKLVSLVISFVLGVIFMTFLLLTSGIYMANTMIHYGILQIVLWAAACSALIIIGVAVWLFYFRPGKGTILWIPRFMAEYLTRRCSKTKSNGEAFSLGISSVVGEIIFLLAPIVVSILFIINMPIALQISGVALYILISVLPLVVVCILVNKQNKLSRIQKWREENKRFIQLMTGSIMLAVGFFVYASEVLAVRVLL